MSSYDRESKARIRSELTLAASFLRKNPDYVPPQPRTLDEVLAKIDKAMETAPRIVSSWNWYVTSDSTDQRLTTGLPTKNPTPKRNVCEQVECSRETDFHSVQLGWICESCRKAWLVADDARLAKEARDAAESAMLARVLALRAWRRVLLWRAAKIAAAATVGAGALAGVAMLWWR